MIRSLIIIAILIWTTTSGPQPSMCRVFGTVYDCCDSDPATPKDGVIFTIKEVKLSGTLLLQYRNKRFKTGLPNAPGYAFFYFPRNSIVKIKAAISGFDGKTAFTIPNADSVDLATFN